MIQGTVNADLEALISIAVLGDDSPAKQVEAIIDTGFSGHLTLPASLIASLNLAWLGREPGVLADGIVDDFEVYRGTVMWGGRERPVEVIAVDNEPLAGMALLAQHSVQIDVVDGGAVAITPLP